MTMILEETSIWNIHAADERVRAARIRYRGKGKYIDELL